MKGFGSDLSSSHLEGRGWFTTSAKLRVKLLFGQPGKIPSIKLGSPKPNYAYFGEVPKSSDFTKPRPCLSSGTLGWTPEGLARKQHVNRCLCYQPISSITRLTLASIKKKKNVRAGGRRRALNNPARWAKMTLAPGKLRFCGPLHKKTLSMLFLR